MADAVLALKDFKPAKEFFVGVDSDGCIFDTMEIKQKECFAPQFINHFEMQPVSKYARETWEFVNLYSKDRGVNRFPALLRALELIAERPEVRARGVAPPELRGLRDWVARETKLGNAVLKAEAARSGDPDLERVLAWSEDVNAAVEKIVRNVPPFPLVRESLEKLGARADRICCSQTPTAALEREWEEHGIRGLVRCICGQELGTKAEHLRFAAGGKYPKSKCLMVGDAPGDLKAARANDFLFYPINPGAEEASWKRFYEEAIDRFFAGGFAGAYQEALIREFEAFLPEAPPWRRSGPTTGKRP
jgi:phosphoglycolate phosphatase-like HAD superfamily hydrolase